MAGICINYRVLMSCFMKIRSCDEPNCMGLCLQNSPDAEALIGGEFAPGEKSEYWLENVKCEGNEESLFACLHPGKGIHSCGRNERAGVRCHGTVCTFPSLQHPIFYKQAYSLQIQDTIGKKIPL